MEFKIYKNKYIVFRDGTIYSIELHKPKIFKDDKGRDMVSIYLDSRKKAERTVDHLVAELFCELPKDKNGNTCKRYSVNHKDGDIDNHDPDNLEVVPFSPPGRPKKKPPIVRTKKIRGKLTVFVIDTYLKSYEEHTVKSAAEALKCHPSTIFNHLDKTIYRKRYIITTDYETTLKYT